MSRKPRKTNGKTEDIKPDFSVHLEELLKDKGLRKYELAAMIHTSPQTISKACNGIRLTRSMAESIVKLYPEYYIGWLLGYPGSPKYRNEVKVQIKEAKERAKEFFADLNDQFFDSLSSLCSAKISGPQVKYENGKLTIQSATLPQHVPFADEHKELFEYHSTEIDISLDKDEMKTIKDDIIAFLNYRLSREICQKNNTVRIVNDTYLTDKEAK